ncbi:MAG TPA: cytochrome c biogenesis protein DipZ [Terriglobales bacterium]|nr:cytochrome c biogenesis protein DipZ [Terriglobales bacterium]
MFLFLLAFLGGVLTILSPCILPVLPFVFARADQPFRRSTLPMLGGMAVTFAIFAVLATAGGNWIIATNQYGRILALVVMAILGLTLLVPALAELLARPFVRLGARLQKGRQEAASPAASLVLGASIGLLWAPCAGPILGLVLAASALSGVTPRTLGLLLAFALGAAASLAVALLAGQRVFQSLKRSLGAEEWVRRALGALVLVGVVAIALGADTRLLAAVQYFNTNGLEQKLVARLHQPPPVQAAALPVSLQIPALPNEGPMPSLNGATDWINSPPLTSSELRGKVVLVDFWTYSCINCLRSLPYIEAWANKYKDQGLVVIGVHSPEFAFERDPKNVAQAVSQLKLTFPVAVDSSHKIWNAFKNEYWPADYFVDAQGNIRFHHFGEGSYAESEHVIQALLAEAHHQSAPVAESTVQVAPTGAEAPAAPGEMQSPETYIGYDRGERFASPQRLLTDMAANYTAPLRPSLNQWGLAGDWKVSDEMALLLKAPGSVIYRFHARDLHLVLGSASGKPIRFRITIDGTAPGPDHGADVDEQGNGTVTFHRLYQLVRQKGKVEDRTFTIEFLDPGVQAFAFTFG